MKDTYGTTLKENDIIIQIVDDDNLPKGSEWVVLGFGIEPSTQRKVCIMKDNTKGYIMSAYQSELKYFRKKVEN